MNFYSQNGEDFIALKLLSDQKSGFFIEIGCIDGKRFSNTLALEQLGWTGLCIEAHPDYIDLLKRNRPNSKVSHAAIGDENVDQCTFYTNKRGSLSTLDKSKEKLWKSDYGKYFSGFKEALVPQKTIDSVIEAYKIDKIDVLSLDIEGSEVEALKGINLKINRPRLFIIEADTKQQERRIDKILLPANYHKVLRLRSNIFYSTDMDLGGKIEKSNYHVKLIHTKHPIDQGSDRIVSKNISPIKCRQPTKLHVKKYLKTLRSKLKKNNSSIEIKDKAIITKKIENPEFPFLVSFPRTGSHWLRMIMESYFQKPSLVRVFYYKNAKDFTCYHSHDMKFDIERQNVVYLYRNPVDTIYSQMNYLKHNIENKILIKYWSSVYGLHLAKWLLEEKFTKKKTIITYEGLKDNISSEFEKVCRHFDSKFDQKKLDITLDRISKEQLKSKTTYDAQVVNLSKEYEKNRNYFKKEFSDYIHSLIIKQNPDLNKYFTND